MAKIITRTWKSPGPLGRPVKHVAYGYTFYRADGARERKVSSAWGTAQAALTALTARLEAIAAGQLGRPTERTFGAVATEYLRYKTDQGKRTVASDQRILERRLLPAFGKELNVRQFTTAAIAQYEKQRLGQVSAYTVANEISVLRHLLRLAKRWGYLAAVPEITLPKKPEAASATWRTTSWPGS